MEEYLRIGLMGSASTGKTTISKSLSQDLNIELHGEFESTMLKRLIKRGIIENSTAFTPDQLREFQQRAIGVREKFSERKNYISDRTAGELWVYHKKYRTECSSQEELELFRDRCLKVMSKYTHLFLFPFGQIPLENNGWRNIDSFYQREIHTEIEKMLLDFQVPYIQLKEEKFSVDERLQEILKWIKK